MQVGCHHDPIYSKISAEEQLMDDLLIGYNPLILPTPNNSISVKVPFLDGFQTVIKSFRDTRHIILGK